MFVLSHREATGPTSVFVASAGYSTHAPRTGGSAGPHGGVVACRYGAFMVWRNHNSHEGNLHRHPVQDMISVMRIRRVRRQRAGRGRSEAFRPVVPAMASGSNGQSAAEASARVLLAGSRLFNLRMAKTLAGQAGVEVVATAESARDAVAAVTTHRAELAMVEVGVAGVMERAMLARAVVNRSPGCGIMLVCSTLTEPVARSLWVYGTESWSVITGASSKNPEQMAEAVRSAVRGMLWVEPGVRRVMASFGPRPKSIEERRLLMLDGSGAPGAVAA